MRAPRPEDRRIESCESDILWKRARSLAAWSKMWSLEEDEGGKMAMWGTCSSDLLVTGSGGGGGYCFNITHS